MILVRTRREVVVVKMIIKAETKNQNRAFKVTNKKHKSIKQKVETKRVINVITTINHLVANKRLNILKRLVKR